MVRRQCKDLSVVEASTSSLALSSSCLWVTRSTRDILQPVLMSDSWTTLDCTLLGEFSLARSNIHMGIGRLQIYITLTIKVEHSDQI